MTVFYVFFRIIGAIVFKAAKVIWFLISTAGSIIGFKLVSTESFFLTFHLVLYEYYTYILNTILILIMITMWCNVMVSSKYVLSITSLLRNFYLDRFITYDSHRLTSTLILVFALVCNNVMFQHCNNK